MKRQCARKRASSQQSHGSHAVVITVLHGFDRESSPARVTPPVVHLVGFDGALEVTNWVPSIRSPVQKRRALLPRSIRVIR